MKKYTNEELTNNIISMFKIKLEKDYDRGNTKRDAHSKCTGLLKAYFIIDKNLDKKYRVGIFQPNKIYPALIRTSSSNPKVKSDKSLDFRGFSVKVLGVEGKRCTHDEKQSQDFLLISNETMPIGNLKLFHDSIYYLNKSNPIMIGMKILTHNNVLELIKTMKNLKHISSPLDINYYGTTPYLFGDKIVKYKIIPKSNYKSKLPKNLTDRYLTTNMQKHLKNEDAVFEFCVQFWKNNKDMPINNASVKWSEKLSPYIKVAEIRIPKQNFISKERFELAEVLSYSPGHSLIEHKPIGDINEARVKIYEEMSKFRHERNNKKLFEPTKEYFDKID